MHESLLGRIVISVGMFGHLDYPSGARHLCSDDADGDPTKGGLDALHLRKIDLADEILVINLGGYVGTSTRREIEYARSQRKNIRFMFPEPEDA